MTPGFDMDLDGTDSHSIQYQNANNSVRVTDDFMRAVEQDLDWQLSAVKTGEALKTMKARDLFREIARAAWECADPGMQFDTTINRWHTAANTGRINGSNPCSEYMHLDNSACNLASLNLLAFLHEDGEFDVEGYKAAVEVVFTAQEILVGNADYPTEKIADTSRKFRQLGLGYANLGVLLMALGMPYDSDSGRAWAGALTALMTGHAYATSPCERPGGWGRSPATPRTASTCCACCGCTGPRPRRSTRSSCRRCCWGQHSSHGTKRSSSPSSSACATRRRRCSRPRARSRSSWTATPRASSPTSGS